MINYDDGKIYALRSHHTDNIYIGSTCSPLHKRLYQHKNHYKNYLVGKFPYLSSFEITKYPDCFIQLMEKCPTNSKMELNKREGELQRANMNCITNKVVMYGGKDYAKYYYKKNKEKRTSQMKQWRNNNKDYHTKYYQDNKEYFNDYYRKRKT